MAHFWDPTSLGFFSTPASAPDLILRLKDGMDSVEPSTNGTSAQNLYRLGSMLEDVPYTARARETTLAFEAEIMQHPFLFSSMTPAIVAGALGVKSVVLVGETKKTRGERLREGIGKLETTVKVQVGREGWLSGRNELVGSLVRGKDARTRVMVCEAGTCREEVEGDDGEKV